MTIKQFAMLCGCNPQTLRYYDHVGLLKPDKVDKWSGYRCYEEDQALTFVKIKNLQKAGFSIGEIRELLDQDNLAIFEAFEKKISEEERRLREIKEIQKSYQTEMRQMKSKVEEIKTRIMGTMAQYDPTAEFGISAEDYRRLMNRLEALMASEGGQLTFDEEKWNNPDRKSRLQEMQKDPAYALNYEGHGWNQIREILPEFSSLEDGVEYFFCIERAGDEADQIPFANVLLNLLLDRNPGKQLALGSDVHSSKDGQNHLWVFKKG